MIIPGALRRHFISEAPLTLGRFAPGGPNHPLQSLPVLGRAQTSAACDISAQSHPRLIRYQNYYGPLCSPLRRTGRRLASNTETPQV